MAHFEDLWNEAEQLLAENTKVSRLEELGREGEVKMRLLGCVRQLQYEDHRSDEEVKSLMTRTMGKLLLTLTQISMKENIDVFAALKDAVEAEKVYIFEKRYK